MIYSISNPSKKVKGLIILPASKSISNRVLIIQQLCKAPFKINNLSQAEDTQILQQLLSQVKTINKPTLNVGHAGTTMRFLTSYLSVQSGEFVLTGSDRMKQRPIGLLINTLQQLGASISYLEKAGYPPLMIKGKALKGGKIEIQGNISSQFISSLLLIAPTLSDGIILHLKGKVISIPYIQMTLKLMKYFGVKATWVNNTITVPSQTYIAKDIIIESDWSAASYWYEIASLADNAELTLTGLTKNSLQGDAMVAKIYENFGIITAYTEKGIYIKKNVKYNTKNKHLTFHLSNYPDIAQTIAVTCSASLIPVYLTGLGSLKIKETNRILALKNELLKLGIALKTSDESIKIDITSFDKSFFSNPNLFHDLTISTYTDHRMAMAFAPLALKIKNIQIENPSVVIKSYPNYWNDLQNVGFEVH